MNLRGHFDARPRSAVATRAPKCEPFCAYRLGSGALDALYRRPAMEAFPMSVSLKSTAQITPVDPVWDAVRANAQAILKEEPSLTSMVIDNVLNHDRFENALAHRLAVRLDHTDVSAGLIEHAFMDALDYFPEWGNEARADLAAAIERDPAAHRAIVPFLYFKGYQAIQTHRFAHALWK